MYVLLLVWWSIERHSGLKRRDCEWDVVSCADNEGFTVWGSHLFAAFTGECNMEKSCINKLIVISWVAVMLPISQQSSAGLDGKVNGNMFETRRHLLHTRMGSGHSPSRFV